jgi:DNA-binding beta-propeller fold protein YncE
MSCIKTKHIFCLIILLVLISTNLITQDTVSFIALYNGSFGSKGDGDGEFIEPLGITLDDQGNLYVVDSGNCRVQVFNEEGEFIRSIGDFGWEAGKFLNPSDCAVDDNLAIYVADMDKGCVYKFSEEGVFLGEITLGDEKEEDLLISGSFDVPTGIAVGRSGELLVVNSGEHRIDIFNRLEVSSENIGGFGRSEGFFNNPLDCGISRSGRVYVADSLNNRVQIFDRNYKYLKTLECGPDEGKIYPLQIDVGPDEYFVLSDGNSNTVLVYNSLLRKVLTISGEKVDGFSMPYGVAINDEFLIYISDRFNHRIVMYQLTEPPPEK